MGKSKGYPMMKLLTVALMCGVVFNAAHAESTDFTASPDVVAAVTKMFPTADPDDVGVFDFGTHKVVKFGTADRNVACTVTFKPVKLSKCKTVHQ